MKFVKTVVKQYSAHFTKSTVSCAKEKGDKTIIEVCSLQRTARRYTVVMATVFFGRTFIVKTHPPSYPQPKNTSH
jgi:hypothetical protein